MKIAHISDVHIRNFKYHEEYRRVFDALYDELEILKPDLIVNTGDTAHTKTQISPEFVSMLSDHMRAASTIAPYHLILGNHDMSLMNLSRQDAITPVVESIGSNRIFLHKKSGRFAVRHRGDDQCQLNFWVFSLADQENYPRPVDWAKFPDDNNIGLFHGSVLSCVTDSNWRMTHVEHDLSIFDGLDYVMMGDIHKQQSFNNSRAWYPGSLIQQNFGEELDKGFLLWEFDDNDPKKQFTVKPILLSGSRKFYTIHPKEDLSFPEDLIIEPDAHVRLSPPFPLTLVQQKEIEKNARLMFSPHDVITLSATNISEQKTNVGKRSVDHENLREIPVQERLIRNYFKGVSITDSVMSKVLDLNRKFQIHIDQNDDSGRDIFWKINKIGWSNFFNYGKDNFIDFSQLGGLTGIFAPNGSGKSNMIDILTLACFDNVTKGVSKNIFLINDNKDSGTSIADVTANGQDYMIERNIERIKYGHKKFSEAKEWGKTTTSFSMIDEDGGIERLVGTLRPETEANIRQRVGTFEDFMLTALVAQWNQMDLIACNETRRREIFFKFFDLDVFEKKNRLAKEEFKKLTIKLSDAEESELEKNKIKLLSEIEELDGEISKLTEKNTILKSLKITIDRQIEDVSLEKIQLGKFVHIDSARDKLTLLQRENQSLDDDRIQTSIKLTKMDEEFSSIPVSSIIYDDIRLFELKALKTSGQELVDRTRDSLIQKKAELTECQKSAAILETVPCGTQFPGCRFLINGFESAHKIEKLDDELRTIEFELERYMIDVNVFSDHVYAQESSKQLIDARTSLNEKKEKIKLELENITLKMSALYTDIVDTELQIANALQMQEDIMKNLAIDAKIAAFKKDKIEIEEKLEQNDKSLAGYHKSSGNKQAAFDMITKDLTEIAETRDMCSAYERYIDAMGKDGIAYQILTQKLPLLNEEINKILSGCTDFGVMIEADPEDQSIRFFLQYGEYKMRLLELGGGAEKFLASLAIRTALLNISNLPKTNVLIIDEGFGKLDTKNVENVQRMFDYLKTVYDHVLIISHLDTMKDMVDNVIEITTDDEGYAHVEVGAK